MEPMAWFKTSGELILQFPLHPVVANPYTFPSTFPLGTSHFSSLESKATFFSILLEVQSQNIFAFTWIDPDTHFLLNAPELLYLRDSETTHTYLARPRLLTYFLCLSLNLRLSIA